MTPKIIAFATVVLLVTMSAAQAQEFLPYEGKKAFSEGDGGTKRIVNDIEFWADGAPPKKFKLLGYITDRRFNIGFLGMISMSSLDSDIAKVAKENGGDAVILVSSKTDFIGPSLALLGNNSKYAVVKYISNDSPMRESQPKEAKPELMVEVPKPDSLQPDAIDVTAVIPVTK